MFLVAIEADDGIWFDGPEGFTFLCDAEEYASNLTPPDAYHTVVIYTCAFLKVYDGQDRKTPKGSPSWDGFN